MYDKIGVNPEDFDNGALALRDYYSIPPMFFTKDLANAPFINRFAGATGFLIASGPSFKELDHSQLSGPGIWTMGINNSPATFRPNFWTCVDSPESFLYSVWKDPRIEKIVPISHRNKKLFNSITWKDIGDTVGDCPNVFYYRRNEVVNTENYLFEDTINWGNHSNIGGGRSVFLAAMRIMFLYGFRKVYLLGADFHMDKDNKYHFPQERSNGSIRNNMNTYSSMNKWFSEMKPTFDSIGFKVFNCNPKSRLEVFPHIAYADAIKDATKDFPVPALEKTEGMYTKKADAENDKKVIAAKQEAAKYTDADRTTVKTELDAKRAELNKAKDEVMMQMARMTEPPTADQLKVMLANKSKPTEPDGAKLYDLKVLEEEKRSIFRECERRKNMIWGIIR